MNYLNIKEVFDRLFALLFIIFLSPLLIIISLLVFLDLGFPLLFVHERPGLKEKPFKLYKFRTMKNFNNKKDNKSEFDKSRTTRMGSRLRELSLDELPQFLNILKGEMSFVGPRPLLMEYLPLYSSNQRERHNVKPGLTCLSQINGRNLITWDKKFFYDIKYVNNISFILDIKILLITFWKVIIREGINSSKNTTMDPFKGKL